MRLDSPEGLRGWGDSLPSCHGRPARLVPRSGGCAGPVPVLGRSGLGLRDHRPARRKCRPTRRSASRRPATAAPVGLVAGRRGRADGARCRRRAGGPLTRWGVARRPRHTPGKPESRSLCERHDLQQPRGSLDRRSGAQRCAVLSAAAGAVRCPDRRQPDAVRPRCAEPAGAGRAVSGRADDLGGLGLDRSAPGRRRLLRSRAGSGRGGRLRGGTVLRRPRDQPRQTSAGRRSRWTGTRRT